MKHVTTLNCLFLELPRNGYLSAMLLSIDLTGFTGMAVFIAKCIAFYRKTTNHETSDII